MNNLSNMRWYRLSPADSWFFRDSRPSNAGEDQSDLQSIFPPYPQTVVGAIRAALARELGWNPQRDRNWSDKIKRQLGDGFDDVTPLNFTSPLLAQRAGSIDNAENYRKDRMELLFPVPQHLLGVVQTESEGKTFVPHDWLQPSKKPYPTDVGELLLPVYPKHEKYQKRLQTADDFLVTARGLQQILAGQIPQSDELLPREELWAIEPRIGINRDPEERSMYSPAHVRLRQDVSLVIGIAGLADNLELPQQFPLGGESRLAVCRRLQEVPELPESTGRDLLTLIAPADFNSKTNWYGAGPGDDARQLDDSISGRVETCFIDRPVKIGGFDSRSKSSIPLRPHVPAGSVWWLADNSTMRTSPFSIGARQSLGYGLALFGQRPR